MAGPVLNYEKYHFMVQEGIVLGYKISEKGIVTPKKTKLKFKTGLERLRS
jgi:uncharacterized membrane protein